METEKWLIDVEDALRRMENAEHLMHKINGIKVVDIGAVRQFFGMMKPVDAVEVVHGRWVLLAEFFDGSICTECSVCGEEYTYKKGRLELIGVEYAKYNYCPNCGAKMDGDGDGDG